MHADSLASQQTVLFSSAGIWGPRHYMCGAWAASLPPTCRQLRLGVSRSRLALFGTCHAILSCTHKQVHKLTRLVSTQSPAQPFPTSRLPCTTYDANRMSMTYSSFSLCRRRYASACIRSARQRMASFACRAAAAPCYVATGTRAATARGQQLGLVSVLSSSPPTCLSSKSARR